MDKIKEALKAIDKKLFIYLGIVVFIAIVGIVVSIVIYQIKNSNLSYSEVEEKLESAARNYYADNANLLPKKDGGEVTIRDSKLSEEGYMKPMEKMIKDASCNGKVVVRLNDKKYKYIAYLDCGKEYQTKEIANKIVESGVVSEDDGLYQIENDYVFRGEKVNNYLEFNNRLFRIVRVYEDGTVKMMLNDDYREKTYVWDNRYNVDVKFNYGYNTYEKSRLKEALDSIYEKNRFLTDDSYKAQIVPVDLCVGKRNSTDTRSDVEVECSEKLENQYVFTITAYDFMLASIDEKCTYATARSCRNYNYMVTDFSYWTITADPSTTYNAYKVSGSISSTETSDNNALRPTIVLASDNMYASGDGTKENPYMIK